MPQGEGQIFEVFKTGIHRLALNLYEDAEAP